MKIHRNQIPDEGLHLAGEEDGDYLDLPGEDIRQVGPLQYDLDAGAHGNGIWAAGSLALSVEQTCVRCLKRFVMRLHVNNFAVQKESGGKEAIDLTPEIREDILLALPANPDCHRHGGLECEGLEALRGSARKRSKAGDSGGPGDGKTGPVPEAPSPWADLDQLQIKRNRKS